MSRRKNERKKERKKERDKIYNAFQHFKINKNAKNNKDLERTDAKQWMHWTTKKKAKKKLFKKLLFKSLGSVKIFKILLKNF